MRPEILGLFIPIVFLVGLFAVIALNIVAKYKIKSLTANRMTSPDEWHKGEVQVKLAAAQVKVAKAEARAMRNRMLGLRLCGLLAGLGLGIAVGCIILACGGIPDNTQFDKGAIAAFMIIGLTVFCGGLGMTGAYFLERRFDGQLDRKSK